MGFLRCLLFLLASQSTAFLAAESPILAVRLYRGLSTEAVRVGDGLEGVVVAPALHEGKVLVPSGWTARGSVAALDRTRGRQHLRLDFGELVHPDGNVVPVQTRVSSVDNAREIVDSRGFILSRPHADLGVGRFQRLLTAALLGPEPMILSAFGGFQLARKIFSSSSIVYSAGVELNLAILDPEAIRGELLPPVRPPVEELPETSPLVALARSGPYQTFSLRMNRPADLVNVILIGTEGTVAEAFAAAGWVPADEMNLVSRAKLAFAFARHRPYQTAPMSHLVLENELPAMELQKANNTVAMRHHIRLYRGPETSGQRTVWYGAATHDVAIEYSYQRGKFIHRIDSDIDKERQKIVDDLLFTGRVGARALAERPHVPKETTTASGVPMRTDGRVAVLVLHGAPRE